MEEEFDDCEFWLPPQFLADDDFTLGLEQSKSEPNEFPGADFQHQVSYCLSAFASNSSSTSNSGLTSPGESATESDEDNYISGLTQRMAHSTLEENSYNDKINKVWEFSGSPKSPLCKPSLNRYSPMSHSLAGVKQNERAWDVLCAAAGEVARMKMAEESAGIYSNGNGLTARPLKVNSVSVSSDNLASNIGARPNQPQISYQQLQAARFEQLRRQQMLKQQQQPRGGGGVWEHSNKGGCGHLYPLNQPMAQRSGARRNADGLAYSAWPTLQQSQQKQQQQTQPVSGMRAVFLGTPAIKRECAGTGVFLPRRIGSVAETRKTKPACSTVLLPDRVVQALNLNLEMVDAVQPSHVQSPYKPATAPDLGSGVKYGKNFVMAQQRQQSFRPAQQLTNQEEVRLPQEWTY